MKKILKIAKLEFSILFYSPVAWLVLAIFMIQCSLGFLNNLQSVRTSISSGFDPGPLTKSLFGGRGGLFTSIQETLYLYLPILTMGLMSRETSSGSIKLLLSSPVKIRQIILGKYLAIITYGLTLIGVLTIYAVIGGIFIKNADIGMICSGLLGLYLLICTYAAIGLFMSCLTTYQVVAAISTLAVFAALRFMGGIGQDIDFVRDLTWFLSISGRTDDMVAGMVTTKTLFYYLIIIASFLMLCILRLKGERELKPWTVKAGRYVAMISCALLLGYVTSRPSLTGYLDVTTNESLTITKRSQAITRQLEGPLKVTTYINMLAPRMWSFLPVSRNADLARIEPYRRFIPGLEMNYVYYYDNPVDSNNREYKYNPNLRGINDIHKIAETSATVQDLDLDRFIPPSGIDKKIGLESEGNLVVRKLEYKGKSTFSRFFIMENNIYPAEGEMMAAFKRLIIKVPKVVFVTGHNERSVERRADRDYKIISSLKTSRGSLINNGFDIDTVNLARQEIPADASIVVLSDPTVAFTAAEQQKLAAYINKGGNMYINGEPGRQQILNPVLQTLGVQLKPGILLTPDRDGTPGFLNALPAKQSMGLDLNIDDLIKAQLTVAMQGVTAVEYQSSGAFMVKPLLLSAADGWNKVVDGKKAGIPLMRKSRNVPTGAAPAAMKAAGMLPAAPTGAASSLGTEELAMMKAMMAKRENPTAAGAPAKAVKSAVTLSEKELAMMKAASEKNKKVAANAASGVQEARVMPMGMSEPNPADAAEPAGSIDLTTMNTSFNAAAGDEKGVFPVTVALSRKVNGNEQRIIVSGDGDFISNGELSRGTKRGENRYYTAGVFRWLSNGAFPVDVSKPAPLDTDIKVSREQISALMWLCKWIIPAIIAVLGAITLFKRRRK